MVRIRWGSYSPQVAVDSSGNAVAVWYQPRTWLNKTFIGDDGIIQEALDVSMRGHRF
ncbi:MAG: hypothetical protein R6U37_05095 [Dehalococcoidia bacterium]